MVIGILGGGQLGWMTILEGRKLGVRFAVLDMNPGSPACRLADFCFTPDSVEEFVRTSDVITWEFEHIEGGVLESCSPKLISPNWILDLKKSRAQEKTFLSKRGFPTPEFTISSGEGIDIAIQRIGLPAVVKRDAWGYDGKGQFLIRDFGDMESFRSRVSSKESFVVEKFIDFRAEVSLITVRDRNGRTYHYPMTENTHREGILIKNRVVYNENLIREAREINEALCRELSLTGLLAVEYFVTKEGRLLVNEFAPRPHNTGHYTLDGAVTSQFENLVRVLMGLPTGSTDLVKPSAMVNIIGKDLDSISVGEILEIRGTKLYWYGKEPRSRRKMGHVNIVSDSFEELDRLVNRVESLIYAGARV